MTFEQIMRKEGFEPNEEQRQVIESTCNTVVSAGAGAGKTAVLSWRFLKLVMDCGARPDQILTLTFTKKAASEMRERIYKRLLEAKDSIPEESLKSFSNATIATLDSFCAQIVRSDCISYGLPRDITNLSDEDLDTISARLAQKFLADPENAKETELIASLFMPSKVMECFFSEIARNVSISRSYDAETITSSFMEEVKKLYYRKRILLSELFAYLGDQNIPEYLREQLKNYSELLDAEAFGPNDYFRLKGKTNEEVKQTIDAIKLIFSKESKFYALQNLAKQEQTQVSLLQQAVEKYADMLIEEKRRNGVLSFNDVSELSVSILRDNLKVRKVFQERYRYIMIDEFQDNNSLQRDLLFLLAGKPEKAVAGRVPTIADIDDSKLFFVGDEKQSIYKFRGAEVSVFRRLQDDISQNGSSLSLGKNYRSQAKLIKHFNEVFRKVLEDDGKDYSARFAPIEAGRKSDLTDPRIIFSVYDKDELKPEVEPDIHEAEVIADYCNRAINTDDFLVNGKRLKPEEIAIIFRTASNQMNIEKALKRRDLPYEITETRSLMLEAVASDFYSYLNCLLYPEDVRGWMALLRSPFCGLCDESIIRLIKENREVCEDDRSRYEHFLGLFNHLKSQAFRLTLPQLLETLFIEGGYKAYLNSNDKNRSFLEHYEYLYSYGVQFESEGKGLSDYVRFLRRNINKVAKLPDCSVLHRENTGIQIMTVHKSKGLEFKLVIFAGLGSMGQADETRYVFRMGDDLVATEDRNIQHILDEEYKNKENAELKRVMYVAFTRAKDHLVLVGGYKVSKTAGINSGKLFKWYADAIGFDCENGCSCPDVVIENVSAFEVPLKVVRDVYGVLYQTDYIDMDDRPQFGHRVSRLSVTDLEAQLKDNNYTYNDPLPAFPADVIVGKGSLFDRFGTLCHYVLECLVGSGSYADVDCDLCESDSDNKVLLEQAKAFADGFVASSFYRDKVRDRQTRQEVHFYTCQENPEAPVLEGVIDLLVFGKDYNLVIDYKTDSYRNPEQHRLQVQTYIKAAEELYGKKCYGTLFYLRDSSISQIWDRTGKVVEL